MWPSRLLLLWQASGQRLCRLGFHWASLERVLRLGSVRLSWVWVLLVAGLDGVAKSVTTRHHRLQPCRRCRR